MSGGSEHVGDSWLVDVNEGSHPSSSERVREIATAREWDDAILSALDSDELRQGHAWGEVRRAIGYVPHRLAAFAGGVPLAALAVEARSLSGLGASVLYGSRGPAIAPGCGQALAALLVAVSEIARRSGAVFLRLSPPRTSPIVDRDAWLRAHGFISLPAQFSAWNAPRVIMTLDLRPSETELKRQMRDTTRRALERAPKLGVAIAAENSHAALHRFHHLLVRLSAPKGVPVHRAAYFAALHSQYLARGAGRVVLATHRGVDIAGALTVRFGRSAFVLYAATDVGDAEIRSLRAGVAVHWETIRWAKAGGCEILDWGGSGTHYPPRDDDPGLGVYEFKRGFGSSVTCLPPYYDLVFRPVLYRAFRLAESCLLPTAWRLRGRLNGWLDRKAA